MPTLADLIEEIIPRQHSRAMMSKITRDPAELLKLAEQLRAAADLAEREARDMT